MLSTPEEIPPGVGMTTGFNLKIVLKKRFYLVQSKKRIKLLILSTKKKKKCLLLILFYSKIYRVAKKLQSIYAFSKCGANWFHMLPIYTSVEKISNLSEKTRIQ